MTKTFNANGFLDFMKSYTYAIFCTNDKEGPALRVYVETKKLGLEEDEEGHWLDYYGDANDSFNWTRMVWIPGDVFVFSYEELEDFTGTKYVNGTLKSDKMDLVLNVVLFNTCGFDV